MKGLLAILPETELDAVMLHFGIAGTAQVEHPAATLLSGPGDILVHTTRADKRLIFDEGRHEIVLVLPMAIVHQAIEEQFGLKLARSIELLFVPDRDTPLARALFAFGCALQAGLSGTAPLLASPIGLRRYRDSFVALMLTCLRVEELRPFASEPALASLREVERAEAYIETNAMRAIGVSDIAEHLGVSMRMLQYAFRRHRETTPLAALRKARLDGVRRDLLGSEPQLVSVVGARWGFTHPGRLARLYKTAFGERLSETVNRARGRGA